MPKKQEFIYLRGKTKWFRHVKPDKFEAWSHKLYPNAESLSILYKMKEGTDAIKNVISKDEDGEYIHLKRQTNKTMRGKQVAFTPPIVLGPDNQPTVDPVGNGSDIVSKIVRYWYKPPMGPEGSAIRWESSKIMDLVPFEAKRDFDEDDMKQVGSLPQEQPKDYGF